ncbi:MAG: hypothetical protein ABS46_06855 [Cytophagaceae bacterium SCN 52-12]|nr:MAG: hypothetical protein ABS46_06855 [Cytophagaceae bacterium SCN 52-12]
MKPGRLLLILSALPFLAGGCTDRCEKTQIVRQIRPVTLSAAEVRSKVKIQAPADLEQPGKIYIKDQYLFINEIKKGIHIIDNSNPSNPRHVSFISIPGNGDMAVKDHILYADSYMDLVAIDISNPEQAHEAGRKQNAFTSGVFDGLGWSYDAGTGTISDQEMYFLEETFETNCEGVVPNPGYWWWGGIYAFYGTAYLSSSITGSSSSSYSGSTAQSAGAGTGGSMARFTLYDDYLYTVDQRKLQLFDVSSLTSPAFVKDIDLGWGVETIFPYRDKLFIGTSTGMHIFDNSTPSEPKHLSEFRHIRACDPVVVHEDVAYVTLRSGNVCGGSVNRLEVVDISNLANPQLVKAYEMQNPAGLSINYPTLFVCEGEYGLKGFDVSDKFAVDKNMLFHEKGMEAYDIISMDDNVMMIGKDGLYQYNASDPKNLRKLSHIPVRAPAVITEKKE